MSRLLVQLSNISLSFGARLLFNDISLSINRGEVVALIGENGSGKTTLLQLLAKHTPKQYRVCYLPQELVDCAPLQELERQMALCLEQCRLEEWERLHAEYEDRGGYMQLPIEDIPLSSGERVRAWLTRALQENPDLLLLDEPTNHLDEEAIEWLLAMLQKREGATVLVSHDRAFLNRSVKNMVEIKDAKLHCYGGGYDYYLEEQKQILARELEAYHEQQKERSMLEQKIKAMTFSKKNPTAPKDRNSMAYDRRGEYYQRSCRHKLDMLKDRLEEIQSAPLHHPKPKSILGLQFSPVGLDCPNALELEGISKAYGDKVLFRNFTKYVERKDRILLCGPNGCGKTTLLRCIMGQESLDSGLIHIARTAKIAYLDQDVEGLPLDQTPLSYFGLAEQELRRMLHMAAIGGQELIHLPFSKLSVGQKKRFFFLKIILDKPNVLLLDEPTNHLDLITLEAFEKALLTFEGAILAISHDRTFINKIATKIWTLYS